MENEKRLIDANAYAYPGDLINEPTVDAVEVVRCKNCKHWKDGVSGCTDHVKCCQIGFYMVGENGYCCYGERREGEYRGRETNHAGRS